MDMNVLVLFGKLAAPPELRTFESGSSLVRSLVTVRTATCLLYTSDAADELT